MTYPGGKGAAGVAQTIINQQPPHDEYIEAFLGGGSVLKTKRPASTNVGIDVDRSVIDKFNGAGSPNLTLLCCNAMRYLRDRRDWTGRELVYCDPPYLMSARRSWSKMYRYEMDDNAHANLLAQIVRLPCMVQISGYESRMYETWLKGWRLVKFQAMTRRGVATECLWMNYSEPVMLHDFSFLGDDYRQRERIKRKAQRWVNRLDSLPRLEKLAIYAEMACSIATNSDTTRPNAPDRTGSSIVTSAVVGRHVSPETEVLQ